MGMRIDRRMRRELTEVLRQRYRSSSRRDKTRILDEFTKVAGYHRKHGIRLLNKGTEEPARKVNVFGRRIYQESVKEALIVVWESADRICGKRLKAILPDLVDAMERHGHLKLEAQVRGLLLAMSASTIDRLLSSIRSAAGQKRKRKSPSKLGRKVPIRTFADWNDPVPGNLEIDFVVHSGGSMAGNYIHTLAATDICSGWIECIPLLAREQSLVVEALDLMRGSMPFSMIALDSDNDGAFINETLLDYCENHGIKQTRSRPYKKNDQAWIEQKNGAVIRKFVGHERFSGIVAAQTLARLYGLVRLYVNFFQPSFKLREKRRNGSKTHRSYHKPATPCERLLAEEAVDNDTKEKLKTWRQKLDPVALLHQIREAQSALAALSAGDDPANAPSHTSLEKYLAILPDLWRAGESRATHRKDSSKPRAYRTRKDPFETFWHAILTRLQKEPEVTAKEIFDALQQEYPEQFNKGQLRTLQRRLRDWRKIMARKLVFPGSSVDQPVFELRSVG